MRLVSLNTNKGLNGDRRSAFDRWLTEIDPNAVLIQEPVAKDAALPAALGNLVLVGGNHFVAAYASRAIAPTSELIEDRWLRAKLGNLSIDNLYLPHESKTARQTLMERVAARPADGRLVVGDFNMAPRPMDGRYGDAESSWTGARERGAFEALLATGLNDLTADEPPEFTFQRRNKGEWTRFRCDLALGSSELGATARADHRPRNPTVGFTDHSAVIVDIDL